MEWVCYQFVLECGQVGYYMLSLHINCEITIIICNKPKNQICFTVHSQDSHKTEIHMKTLHSEPSEKLEKFWNISTNINTGSAGWWFNCNMAYVLSNLGFI